MFEVIVLAIALSMDAFAVSIGLGSKGNTPGLGLKARRSVRVCSKPWRLAYNSL